MQTTATYPDLKANRTKAAGIEHARALATNHMHSVDQDEPLTTAAAWAKARCGVTFDEYETAYFAKCRELGWDGVIGSMVGVRSCVIV